MKGQKKKIESTKPQVIVAGSKTVTFQQTGPVQTYQSAEKLTLCVIPRSEATRNLSFAGLFQREISRFARNDRARGFFPQPAMSSMIGRAARSRLLFSYGRGGIPAVDHATYQGVEDFHCIRHSLVGLHGSFGQFPEQQKISLVRTASRTPRRYVPDVIQVLFERL
jgi:hypothetical protein